MIFAVNLLAVLALALTSPEATREERFANPPGECRLLPIRHNHPADSNMNVAAVRRYLECGFGGYAGNVSFGRSGVDAALYVENAENWPAFRAAADFAKESGMALWLYDELGYPSLSAGDLVLRGHPELEQTGWLIATARSKGGETVEMEVPPGRFLAAVAAQVDDKGRILTDRFLDVSDSVRNDLPLQGQFAKARAKPLDAAGRPALGLAKTREEIRTGPFVWTAPKGVDWQVYVITEDYIFEGTHPECKGMKEKFRYPNPLLKAAAERFVEVNHGAYARHLGSDLGRYFTATFSDEPSLMGNWWRPMPYFVLTSAPGLAERYRTRTGGRNLIADIPYLISDSADRNGLAGRLRIAFWDESARMYEEAYFDTISRWCRSHGFLSGGHLMGEEQFCFHVSHYGDFFRCLKAFDAPSIDCLTSIPSNVPYMTALFAGSARELRGRKHTMVEVSSHMECSAGVKEKYYVNEDEIRGTLNRLIWGGINTFTSYYSWDQFAKNGWDRFSDDQKRALNLNVGRASTMLLRDGHTVADVALFYPAKDIMRRYCLQENVWRDEGTSVKALQDVFDGVAKSLYEDGRCFMVVDEETLERSRVEDGVLMFGDLRWNAIILPDVETLSQEARKNLDAFKDVGGIVLNTKGGDDVAAMLRQKLAPHIEFRNVRVNGSSPIRVSHRRTSEGDVFFVMNDSSDPYDGTALFCGNPQDLMVWDIDKGSCARAPRDGDGRVKVSLPGYRACIYTTAKACNPQSASSVSKGRADDSWSRERVERLLERWCDALIARQFSDSVDLMLKGSVLCPACGSVHGRIGDAVYPFVYLYVRTGQDRYLRAAEAALDWVERTMVRSDGGNYNDYRSDWWGITVFAQIALGKTLRSFGDRIPTAVACRWRRVFERETSFLRKKIDLKFADRCNVNYPASFCEAMLLAKQVTGDESCLQDARAVADHIMARCITSDGLVAGENHPPMALSPNGHAYIDLGYNCEETLPALMAYAEGVGDAQLEDRVSKSAIEHFQFLLPDGGLDNSAGSRAAKWTYYGSRTSDGLLPLLAALAKHGCPWAVRGIGCHLDILASCTLENGLLAGGLHYGAAREPACAHHAFAHAKSLVDLLLSGAPESAPKSELPRETATGVRNYPSMGVNLVSIGDWRATFSANDAFSGPRGCMVGGGAPTMLWSSQTGPLIVGTMSEYNLIENLNMQDLRYERRVLTTTPRFENGSYRSCINDKTDVEAKMTNGVFRYVARGCLKDKNGQANGQYEMSWSLSNDGLELKARCDRPARFVIPVVSPPSDALEISGHRVCLNKPDAKVVLEANRDICVLATDRGNRAFNPVAGVMTVQFYVEAKKDEPVVFMLRKDL